MVACGRPHPLDSGWSLDPLTNHACPSPASSGSRRRPPWWGHPLEVMMLPLVLSIRPASLLFASAADLSDLRRCTPPTRVRHLAPLPAPLANGRGLVRRTAGGPERTCEESRSAGVDERKSRGARGEVCGCGGIISGYAGDRRLCVLDGESWMRRMDFSSEFLQICRRRGGRQLLVVPCGRPHPLHCSRVVPLVAWSLDPLTNHARPSPASSGSRRRPPWPCGTAP